MDDSVVRDLVAMGRFLSSIDGVGIARPSGASPARSVRSVPVPEGAARLAVSPGGRALEVLPVEASTEASPVPAGPRADVNEAEARLVAIREDIGDCQRCRLCSGRTKIVFGQGHAGAALMFVGEGPGADEDASGLAFVGRAGQLLTDMIEKGMKLRRADVFIANVVKCRPPGNRTPETDEILACQGFIEAQIRAIQPRVLVGLGATAAKFLTKTADPISRLRGRFASWEGIPVMPTYHPAYLLRNPDAKKVVWEDLKLVLGRLSAPSSE